MIYSYKLTILKNILEKIVHGSKLNDNERKFENVIEKHIVYMKDGGIGGIGGGGPFGVALGSE